MTFFAGGDAFSGNRAEPVEGRAPMRGGRRAGIRRLSLTALSWAALPPLLLVTASCQRPSEQAAAYAQQAQAMSDSGDAEGALKSVQQAIALRDDVPDYFLLQASIQSRMGKLSDAFQSLQRVLELDAANVSALAQSANIGLQIGRAQTAAEAADRLLILQPNSLVALQVKGLFELFRDHDEEAATYADKILAISPSDEAGTIIKARIHAKAGQFDEALTLIDQAMLHSQKSPALLITKLNLYRALGQPEQMVATYDQLLPLLDSTPSLRLDQINLLYKIGQADAARKAVRAFLAVGSANPADYRKLQRIWFQYDPQPFTRQTIKEARQWPNPIAFTTVGRYLLWQGQSQLADDLYFAARPAFRSIVRALHIRAGFGLGRVEQARKDVDALLEDDSENVDALLLRAHFHQQAGSLALGIEAAQRSIETDPMNPEGYIVLAGLHNQAGARWRAAQTYEDGLNRLPQDFMLIEHYTQFLHKSGDKDRAVSASRAFARALPSSVKAWEIFAAQCRQAGNQACAADAEAGRRLALRAYQLDDPPGTPPDRGLLAKFQAK